MSRKRPIRTAFILLAIVLLTTLSLGLVKRTAYSAYTSCRKLAMTTKGYAVWKYDRTVQMESKSRIFFSDGFNELTCEAMRIGPFWVVTSNIQTRFGCVKNLDRGEMCPEDYFGVNP